MGAPEMSKFFNLIVYADDNYTSTPKPEDDTEKPPATWETGRFPQ